MGTDFVQLLWPHSRRQDRLLSGAGAWSQNPDLVHPFPASPHIQSPSSSTPRTSPHPSVPPSPGSRWDCSKPLQSWAQSTVQNLCSPSETQANPTHRGHSVDDIIPAQGPQCSGQTSCISALAPTPVCHPRLLSWAPAHLPSSPLKQSSSETSLPPLGGGLSLQGAPTLLCSLPARHALLNTPSLGSGTLTLSKWHLFIFLSKPPTGPQNP